MGAAETPTMWIASNKQFWIYTIALIVVWSVVIATAEPSDKSSAMPGISAQTAAVLSKVKPNTYEYNAEKEMKHGRNCKALCEHCGCLGFYCGEECICECNNENSDTECIAVMQRNARKLAIPFEILIQGPTANHFVRNALQFEQNTAERNGPSAERSKRSTVTIYKPAYQNSLQASSVDSYNAFKLAAPPSKNSLRHKRAVSQLDWFTDLANTLVRPAPIGAAAAALRKEEAAAVAAERAAEEGAAKDPKRRGNLDRSWFTDSTKLLLRPAPLFKNIGSEKDDDNNSKEIPPAMRAIEKIPQVLKDTLNNIKEAAIVDDFTEAVRNTLKDGQDVLENNLQTNLDFLSPNIRSDIGEAISKLKFISNGDLDVLGQPPARPVTADSSPKYIIPWFRPVRFLKRVQQAIN